MENLDQNETNLNPDKSYKQDSNEVSISGNVTVNAGDFVTGNKLEFQNGSNVVINLLNEKQGNTLNEQLYLNWIAKKYNRLHLGVFNPTFFSTSGEPQTELLDVYIEQNQARSGERQDVYSPEDEEEDNEIRNLGESIFAVITKEPLSQRCFVITGEPGSGKTTILNRITVGLATSKLNNQSPTKFLTSWQDETQRIPVRIVMHDLINWLLQQNRQWDIANLWIYINELLNSNGMSEYFPQLKSKVQSGYSIIMFDGLDEIPDSLNLQNKTKSLILEFTDAISNSMVLITCRTNIYKEAGWKLHGYKDFAISLFNQKQIDSFIDKWYESVKKIEGWDEGFTGSRKDSLKQASRYPHLSIIAKHPLLLTLMAILHTVRGTLPNDRAELYEDCIRLLLDDWQKTKLSPGEKTLLETLNLSTEDLERVLSFAAFSAQFNQSSRSERREIPYEISLYELIETLSVSLKGSLDLAKSVIDYIEKRSGLIIAIGNNKYTFPHRTFQEYLSACYLLSSEEFPYNLAEFARNDPFWWREVVLLAAGKAKPIFGQAVSLINALLEGDYYSACSDIDWQISLLASEVASEINLLERVHSSAKYNKTLYRIHTWLRELINENALSPLERLRAGELLAGLGGKRSGVGLTSEGIPDIEFCLVPDGNFIYGSQDNDNEAYENEKPCEIKKLPAFRVSKFLITNDQYMSFVRDTKRVWSNSKYNPRHSHNPATNMSWIDAVSFCEWITEKYRAINKIGDNELVRLPFETEWEKAARGENGYKFPWGMYWKNDCANTWETSIRYTSPAGIFTQGSSPYGCFDMVGNVWEWTMSDYEKDATDLIRPYSTNMSYYKVVRGGSWNSTVREARVACKDWVEVKNLDIHLGFRVVITTVVN